MRRKAGLKGAVALKAIITQEQRHEYAVKGGAGLKTALTTEQLNDGIRKARAFLTLEQQQKTGLNSANLYVAKSDQFTMDNLPKARKQD